MNVRVDPLSSLASGIGRAVAHGYAKAGVAGLYACDINLDGLSITAEECRKVATNPNFRIIAAKVDVRDEEDVIAMVNAAVKEFGRLDYAANVAGVSEFLYTAHRSKILTHSELL